MRGALAKTLRGRALGQAPFNLSSESRYQPVPGTGRMRVVVVPQPQADGTIQMVKVQVPTVTFRLAPDCSRFFTQRYKRAFVKGI